MENTDNTLLNSNKQIRKVTLVGFFLNAVLTVFKLIAGLVGRSAAMVADAVHSLSDFLTDIVVLVGVKLTAQPEDESHNYGHEKFETVATAIISIFLVVVGFEILKGGITNIIAIIKGEEIAKPGFIALIAAAVSIISKELLYRYTISASKKFQSSSVKANAWHHRSDALSSIGTLIGIGGAYFLGQKWTILDPVASVIVSVFIFKVAYRILKPALDELTEKALPADELEKIVKIIAEEKEVIGHHNLRTRSLGRKIIIEMHIFVDGNLNVVASHDIASHLEKRIKEDLNHPMVITVHIEPFDPSKAEVLKLGGKEILKDDD